MPPEQKDSRRGALLYLRRRAQSLLPVLGIDADFIHEAAGDGAGGIDSLFPRADGVARDAQEASEDSLTRPQQLPHGDDIVGAIRLGLQIESDRVAGKAVGEA